MAGYWGLAKGAVSVAGGSSQAGGSPASAFGAQTTAIGACGLNFGVDVQTTIEGTNDTYLAGAGAGCLPATIAMPSSDTLTLRHASVSQSAATGTGPLRVCSSFTAAGIVNNTATCALQQILGPTGALIPGGIYDLVVNTYYVNRDSPNAAGLPTLYRQTLTNTSGAQPANVNTPILPGVEDMQVQFGIDPTGTTGTASQYVDAQTAAQLYNGGTVSTVQVVAVRIWLLLRSDAIEPGFTETNTYQYANRSVANGTATSLAGGGAGLAYAPRDNFRRLLVSRTIMLRNALGT